MSWAPASAYARPASLALHRNGALGASSRVQQATWPKRGTERVLRPPPAHLSTCCPAMTPNPADMVYRRPQCAPVAWCARGPWPRAPVAVVSSLLSARRGAAPPRPAAGGLAPARSVAPINSPCARPGAVGALTWCRRGRPPLARRARQTDRRARRRRRRRTDTRKEQTLRFHCRSEPRQNSGHLNGREPERGSHSESP